MYVRIIVCEQGGSAGSGCGAVEPHMSSSESRSSRVDTSAISPETGYGAAAVPT